MLKLRHNRYVRKTFSIVRKKLFSFLDVFFRHHDHIRKLVSDATYHMAVRVAAVVYEPGKKNLSQIEDQKIIKVFSILLVTRLFTSRKLKIKKYLKGHNQKIICI